MKKPSTGAIRAAEYILFDTKHESVHTVAAIIDRETGFGELMEAANIVDEWAEYFNKRLPGNMFERLQEALVKAKGK